MYKSAFAAALAAALTLGVSIRAESAVELTGEVSINGGGPNLLVIDLVDETRHQRIASAIAARDGSFRFPNIAAGAYELQVLDGGVLLKREFVDVRQGFPGVVIRVEAAPRTSQGKPGGAVSAARLRHKIPRKALKLFRAGSLDGLEKAVAIDPDYMEAHNNLGCRYLQSGDYPRALQHLERAAELDPSSALTFTNIAVAYVQEQRLQDAEIAVRKALQLGDTSGKAHYVMGIVLLRRGRPREEAVRYLSAAADEFPPARAILDRLR